MKTIPILAVATAFLAFGCKSDDAPTADAGPAAKPAVKVAYDQGSVKKGDNAYCVICVTEEGKAVEEPVAETLEYNGKTYAFCNESEKATFISDPAKYAAK